MRIGVPREIHAGERRVATTPEVAITADESWALLSRVEAGAGASCQLF